MELEVSDCGYKGAPLCHERGRCQEDDVIFLKYTFKCKYLNTFFCLFLCVTPSVAQRLLLALHSGITPCDARGTTWDAGNQTQVSHMQGKRPTRCAITPAPVLDLLRLHHQVLNGCFWCQRTCIESTDSHFSLSSFWQSSSSLRFYQPLLAHPS